MNERYAVDPDAPENADELKLLLDQVGFSTGRFLVRYPEDWVQFVLDRFKNASALEHKRVVELLGRRKAFALPCSNRFQRAKSWPENAVAVKSSSPHVFKAVVGTSPNAHGLRCLRDVLFEDGHAWPPGAGEHVRSNAASYARCAEPLFEFSAEVILMDPYFALRSPDGREHYRQRRVLQAFLKQANASPVCESMRLVLKQSTVGMSSASEARLESDLEDMVAVLGSDKVSVEYEILSGMGHGRYLFSTLGGLQFDQGFDEFEKKTNHVHWLTEPELKPLWERNRFSPN